MNKDAKIANIIAKTKEEKIELLSKLKKCKNAIEFLESQVKGDLKSDTPYCFEVGIGFDFRIKEIYNPKEGER